MSSSIEERTTMANGELRAAVFVAMSDVELFVPRSLVLRLVDAIAAELLDRGCVLLEPEDMES